MIGPLCAAALLGASLLVPPSGDDDRLSDDEFFELRIRPVLANTCFRCHGGEKVSNGLRLDARVHLLKGGKRGPAIVPGEPDRSPLLYAIRYEDRDFRMPPKERLPGKVVADFATWIARGAPWPKGPAKPASKAFSRHWAFRPVRRIDPGVGADQPVDRFIQSARRKAGVAAVAQAGRRTLIRRATFDLIGLPPAPEEVEAFVADERPGAFERVVDRLLASPRYGERWGRHWLDLARYADTAGDDSDYPIPQARLYRDYVIDAFNHDKPYDQFLQEQLAGDLMARSGPPGRYAERVIATGFLAQSKRYATRVREDMHLIIEDTLNTLGKSILGLTLRCARCHDHKYDPLTSEDYYALYGFFQSVLYPHPGSEETHKPQDLVPMVPEARLKKEEAAYLKQHAARIGELKGRLEKLEKTSDLGRRTSEMKRTMTSLEKKLKEAGTAGVRRKLEQARREHSKLAKQLSVKTKPVRDQLDRILKKSPANTVPVAYAIREGKISDARIQIGGEPKRRGKAVKRGVPKFLHPEGALEIASGTSGRLELARWITDRSNPLTARVMVNRIWQHHFGKPIVPTPSNFGLQGEPPTHPELLDTLASEFVSRGWSIKAMHRLIMSSETYRLASAHDASNASMDGGNRWYWRFDRRRLDAESIRDAMLHLGGNLDLSRPGPHPFPPVDKWKWSAHRQFKAVYPSNHRSVYLMAQRLHPHPYLSLFNGPDTTAATDVRDTSTVALQALYMSNSKFVHRQAEGLAQRLLKRSMDARERIRRAYELVTSRRPGRAEIARAGEFVRQYGAALKGEGVAAGRRELETWAGLARVLLTSNGFVYVD